MICIPSIFTSIFILLKFELKQKFSELVMSICFEFQMRQMHLIQSEFTFPISCFQQNS